MPPYRKILFVVYASILFNAVAPCEFAVNRPCGRGVLYNENCRFHCPPERFHFIHHDRKTSQLASYPH